MKTGCKSDGICGSWNSETTNQRRRKCNHQPGSAPRCKFGSKTLNLLNLLSSSMPWGFAKMENDGTAWKFNVLSLNHIDSSLLMFECSLSSSQTLHAFCIHFSSVATPGAVQVLAEGWISLFREMMLHLHRLMTHGRAERIAWSIIKLERSSSWKRSVAMKATEKTRYSESIMRVMGCHGAPWGALWWLRKVLLCLGFPWFPAAFPARLDSQGEKSAWRLWWRLRDLRQLSSVPPCWSMMVGFFSTQSIGDIGGYSLS